MCNVGVVKIERSVANDKSDNKMILGAVHRSPGIYLTPGETPENLR